MFVNVCKCVLLMFGAKKTSKKLGVHDSRKLLSGVVEIEDR